MKSEQSSDLDQVHHVIPVGVLKKNKLVQKAVLEGYDFNGIGNATSIQAFFKVNKRSRKRTSNLHAPHGKYSEKIEEYINNYIKQKGGIDNIDGAQAKEFLEGFSGMLKKLIEKKTNKNRIPLDKLRF